MAEVDVTDVDFRYASISFIRGRKHVPASVVHEGNIITHNAEILGISDAFDASVQISFKAQSAGLSQFNVFILQLPIAQKSAYAAYFEIERETVELLAPILRTVADEIEAQLTTKSDDASDRRPEEENDGTK